MLKKFIHLLINKKNLSSLDMRHALDIILKQDNEAQTAAFLALLKAKGETGAEISSLVQVMSEKMVKQHYPHPLLDIVGTGGDGHHTINISTGSALLAASCGVKIAKHGNRSASSLCGSADVIEQLGINLNASEQNILASIDQYNFAFFYAPQFHPALGTIKSMRKKLGIATVFNLIGPLLNPIGAKQLMIGVADPHYLEPMAQALTQLNCSRALLFNGQGLDEISCIGPIDIIDINNSTVERYQLDPIDYGFKYCSIESLKGGTATDNAKILTTTLQGKCGPIADTFILNAGVANYLHGICHSIEEGIALAKEKHAAGSAYTLIEKLIAHSNKPDQPQEDINA